MHHWFPGLATWLGSHSKIPVFCQVIGGKDVNLVAGANSFNPFTEIISVLFLH